MSLEPDTYRQTWNRLVHSAWPNECSPSFFLILVWTVADKRRNSRRSFWPTPTGIANMCSQRSLLHVTKLPNLKRDVLKHEAPKLPITCYFYNDIVILVSVSPERNTSLDKRKMNIFPKFSKLWCTNSRDHVANIYLSWPQWAAIRLQLVHVAATCLVVFRFLSFYILVLLSILFVTGVCNVNVFHSHMW